MTTKNSLPCSQQPATETYSKPDEFFFFPANDRQILRWISCDIRMSTDLLKAFLGNASVNVFRDYTTVDEAVFSP
jgi:hypothetical protein